jgi:phage gpG-like protein
MITAYLVGESELMARMGRMYPNAKKGLLEAVTRLAIQLQRNVVKDKLSGQVLNVRSGTLRRSISQLATNQLVSQTETSTEGRVGTNVEYAHIHEYGGTIARHSKKGVGRAVYPERSFLRSAMREMESQIKTELENALKQAVK